MDQFDDTHRRELRAYAQRYLDRGWKGEPAKRLARALREAGASDLIPVDVRTLRYVDPYEGAEVVDESERYNV